MNFEKKITFITGATSGIGRGTAEVFAEAGSDLILLARREERLNELKSKFADKYGIDVLTVVCDVRDKKQVDDAVSKITGKWKNIDVLVNNAGLARGLEKIQDGKLENWDEMIDTNVKGLLYVSRKIMPRMVEKNDGMIVNIGSLAGHEVYPNGNVYCASKHAVKAISQAMLIDMNGTGVRVVNVDPGLVETEFANVRFHGDEEKAKKVYQGYKPLEGRDVGEIILFAATRPKHVNIQELLVTPTAQARSTIVDKDV